MVRIIDIGTGKPVKQVMVKLTLRARIQFAAQPIALDTLNLNLTA
jgi:hypothetical protein